MYAANNCRPSTSPTPQFAFADLKKVSQFQQPLLQAIAQNRGRQLPPSRGGNQMMMGPMIIEGSKTGEEKIVSLVERRDSVVIAKPSTAGASTRPPPENLQAGKDAMRMKKLENEIAKLQEMVRRRTSEREDADRRAEDFQNLLNDANRRYSERDFELQGELRLRSNEIDSLKHSINQANARLQKAEEEYNARASGSVSASAAQLAALQEAQSRLETMRLAMQGQIDMTKVENKLLREAGEAADKKFTAATRDAASREDKFQQEIAKFRADKVQSMNEHDLLQKELKSKEETFNEWQTRIDQCRKYIVKICQPSFTVVKDESLTPVSPDDKDAGGFVLVPLTLMLEGYTLLPTDMKKRIADDYEAAKAKKALDVRVDDGFSIQQPRKPVPTSSFPQRVKK